MSLPVSVCVCVCVEGITYLIIHAGKDSGLAWGLQQLFFFPSVCVCVCVCVIMTVWLRWSPQTHLLNVWPDSHTLTRRRSPHHRHTHVFWKVKILHRTHTGNTKKMFKKKHTHIYVFCCQRYRHMVHSRMIRHQTAAKIMPFIRKIKYNEQKDIYPKIKIIWFWLVLPFKRLQPCYLITSSWIQTAVNVQQTRVNQLSRSFWRYLGVVTFVQQTVKQNYFSRRCITNPSSHHTSAGED